MDEKPEKRPRGSSNAKKPSILSRLSFFRSDDDVIPFPSVEDDPVLSPVIEKGRKRKGSLRKAALLGTGRLRLDRRFSTDKKKKVEVSPPPASSQETSDPPVNVSAVAPQPSSSPSPPSSDSSLRLRRRLSALPPSVEIEDWDYSATEWWGWIILLVTWIVFVVGIGSCLEVWSWAWDVGQTPYAPPELEDDPTLPIVGYYPALMVLTAVMSWVWVVVAWMGMKYFRHAKYGGD